MGSKTKRCRICRQNKPKDEFKYKDKDGKVVSHRRCHSCSSRMGMREENFYRRPAAFQ